ncbi:MAG: hypothetical protein LBT40_17935 [Deltaproteobacteria bacterium]|jgi:hypothetical protein|nr:hypothetical protein [Deltaproteobacteria bacterium]
MTALAASLAVTAVLSTAAFFIALVLSRPAMAKAGWTVYDSTESVPEPWPLAFTVSYPSFLVRMPVPCPDEVPEDAGTPAPPPDCVLMNLLAVQPGTGWQIHLSVGRGTLEPEDAETIERGGFGALWDGLGAAVSGATGYAFDGARRFRLWGHEAADLRFSLTGGQDSGVLDSSFITQRYVLKSTENLVLACRFDFPSGDPQAGTFTSTDNPVMRKWGLPFLDSLRLKTMGSRDPEAPGPRLQIRRSGTAPPEGNRQ